MEEEIWKTIKGYEGLYEISSKGRLKSFHNQKVKITEPKFYYNRRSYYHLVDNDKKGKHIQVDILLADAFIPNPHNCRDIIYKDNNKDNHDLNNIAWDDYDIFKEEEYLNEVWKTCPIDNRIELSTLGRLRESNSKKIFKVCSWRGYYYLNLKGKNIAVHRLMMLTFVTDGKNFEEDVHHIDENKINNRLLNLQMIDHREHGYLSRLSSEINYKGKIGRFDGNGILLESFLGERAVEDAGYKYTCVVAVCRGRVKSHKKFYWRRFPIGFEPVLGEQYDLNSDFLNLEKTPPKYIKTSNKKEYNRSIYTL
jgi:NUMOD4 motif/HNH endonuclease